MSANATADEVVATTTEEQQGGEEKKQGRQEKSKGAKRAVLKFPKGTKDYTPAEMRIREEVFAKVTKVFKRHGAVTIETPVFELKEVLTSKYGEDSKLIYDLEDQGGELCSLRYDLTVPFARYCAMNRVKQIKRYHIARVYRRDQPVMTKGRYREFYQCDFDIAGAEFDLMMPDAECLRTICEILNDLEVGDYVVKLNHRKLLDGYFAICGVPEEKFRLISSAVDKLDKLPWDDVRKEMVETKGLEPEVADRIKTFVELIGEPRKLLAQIREQKLCDSNEKATTALMELDTLFGYLDAFGVLDKISFDLSLARGLDYYTGVIYEAILRGRDGEGVGSIAAGGRYDELIGMFGNMRIPAVGVSLGIERCFAILEKRYKKNKTVVRENETEVMVCTMDRTPEMLQMRLKLTAQLWDAGIKAETLAKAAPKIQTQLNTANTTGVPFAVVFGQREIDAGNVQIKDLINKTQVEIPITGMVAELKKLIANQAATSSIVNANTSDKTQA